MCPFVGLEPSLGISGDLIMKTVLTYFQEGTVSKLGVKDKLRA